MLPTDNRGSPFLDFIVADVQDKSITPSSTRATAYSLFVLMLFYHVGHQLVATIIT